MAASRDQKSGIIDESIESLWRRRIVRRCRSYYRIYKRRTASRTRASEAHSAGGRTGATTPP